MTDRSVILGGAGFIGLHLARALHEEGREILLVDDFSRGRRDEEFEAFAACAGVERLECDLTDPSETARLPLAGAEVFLLAARVGVKRTLREPADVIGVNTRIVMNILDASMTSPPSLLILSSTSEVYIGPFDAGYAPIPTGEDVPVGIPDTRDPRFTYAASKIWAENAVFAYHRQHGIPVLVVRYHNVYGPRMGASHVIPELVVRALSGEDPLVVYDPDATRAFCHHSDAVRATIELARCPEARGRIVHIGSPVETRIGDLAERILGALDIERRITGRPGPKGSPMRRVPDVSLLASLTGFEPRVGLDEGLLDTISWYRDAFGKGRFG